MKTKSTFLALLLFVTANLFAQSWTWQYPYPNSNTLNTSYFFNETTGFFGGDFGNLLKTTNGGANISILNTGNNFNINAITFVNSTTGYIGGGYNDKVIMKTTNGGTNWVVTNLGTPYSIKDIKFLNANTGMAITSYQTIYYTTNAGTNWISVNGPAFGFYSLEYVTASLAYITSYSGTAFKSTNGGLNWSSQVVAGSSVSLSDVQFVDSLTGYMCGNSSTVIKTTNGGLNWVSVNATGSQNITSLSFASATTGGAVCDNGQLFKTTNGGTNWTAQYPPPTNYFGLNAIKYFPSGVIYLSGVFGNNMKSTDAGTTWINLVTGLNTYIFSSYFLNGNTGFASMYNGYILKTTNGGTNWIESVTPFTGANITGLSFINTSTGFAIPTSTTNQYMETTDAGSNWFIVNPGLNTSVIGLNFMNATTGVLISQNNTYRTTNGGTNWTFIDSVNYTLNSLQFVNSLTGYIAAYNSPNTQFRKTTNGGINWTTSPELLSNTFAYVFKFIDANTGFTAGGNSLYKTTNGGTNWINLAAINMNAQAIHLFDTNTILIAGSSGVIKKSTDGGLSFTTVPFISKGDIQCMSFVNSMTGWVMGSGGMIIKTNDILTGNISNQTVTPTEYLLHQNYPNPFNPTTKISFEIPKSGLISLKVFDLTGREIATLINEFKTLGKYSVDFNGTNLSSGVYFYKLEANGISEVKKMLLLK